MIEITTVDPSSEGHPFRHKICKNKDQDELSKCTVSESHTNNYDWSDSLYTYT